MPIYDPNRVEYAIHSNYIQVVLDDGRQFPAYGASPQFGSRLPAVALIHDWWGMTPMVRRLANYFAQTGYYVVAPDLFDGKTARTPAEAMKLVEGLGHDEGRMRVMAALDVVERHHHSNGNVAAIGVGMGGGFAFDAAIARPDLEASVAYGGFPQAYFGKFAASNTPILAIYGADDRLIPAKLIDRLRKELQDSALKDSHCVEVIEGLPHEFFAEDVPMEQRERSRKALRLTMEFLTEFLSGPARRPRRAVL